MTIYGTPGGTPLNTSGFQGSTPGAPVSGGLPAAALGLNAQAFIG